MRIKILGTISLGLLAAACQAPYQNSTASAPYNGARQSSTQACVDYGFSPNTASYDRCVSREQAARANGRVNRDYTPTLLTADARNACASYGLAAGTPGYDRCVGREVDARSYRDGTTTTTARDGTMTTSTTTYYRVDANGNRIDAQGYPIDANGVRLQTSAAPTYRVDQYGNPVDAYGNRISGQVSYPATQSQYPAGQYPAGQYPAGQYPAGQYPAAQPSYAAPSVQASPSRDEFGHRYDAQGNRINASGQVIPNRD